MSKYQITRECCGAKETVDIHGPIAKRQGKADRIASQPCLNCQAEAAGEVAGIIDTPLEGSEKQVAWARALRAKEWVDVEDWLNGVIENAEKRESLRAVAVDWFARRPAAKYWIDHRGLGRGVAKVRRAWEATLDRG